VSHIVTIQTEVRDCAAVFTACRRLRLSPPREGTALLQGLAICGRCGRRMTVRYHTRRGVEVPDYECINRCIQDGAQRCQTIPGGTVDATVGRLLLDTLTPHALEVALTVQAELDTRAAEADALRRGHVERARHRADLARRRYLAVDPDNRLVADSLEADWNDALRALHTAHEDSERASTAASAILSDDLKDRIRSLATDFPALWANPNTQQRDRKRMIRLLVDDITLHKTDNIHLHVRLRGGQTHSIVVPIPPTSWQARQTRPDTVAALDRLLDTPQPLRAGAFVVTFQAAGTGYSALMGDRGWLHPLPLSRRTPGGSPDVENTAQPRVRRLSTLLAMQTVAVGYRPSVAMVG